MFTLCSLDSFKNVFIIGYAETQAATGQTPFKKTGVLN